MTDTPSRRSIFKGILAAPVAAAVGGAVARDPYAFGIDTYGSVIPQVPMPPGMWGGHAGGGMSGWRLDIAGQNAEALAERVVTSGYAELVGERTTPRGSQGSWDDVWDRFGDKEAARQPISPARHWRRLSRLRSMSDAAKIAYAET